MMERFALHLRARATDTTLERILGVVRFRGFFLEAMTVAVATPTTYDIRMTINSVRDIANLMSQLRKLFDVESVMPTAIGAHPVAAMAAAHSRPARERVAGRGAP